MVTSKPGRRELAALVAILAFALLVRGGFALLARDHDSNLSGWQPLRPEVEFLRTGLHSSDSQEYLALARGIGAGEFGWGGVPSAWRVPGYPFLLFLLGRRLALVLLVQVLLGGATVALTWVTGRKKAGPVAAGAAAGLVAVDAGSVLMTGVLLAETLFTFLLVLGLWLFVAQRRLPAAGVLGLAVLVRPVGVVLILPFVALLLARREWRHALAFGLVLLLFPAGWAARNAARFGRPALSTDGAFNLYYTHAGILAWEQTGRDEETVRQGLVAGLASDREVDNPVALANRLTGRALARVLRDPLRYGWVHARGAARVLFSLQADDIILRLRGSRVRPELPGWRGLAADPARLVAAGLELLFLAVVIGGGLVAGLRRRALAETRLVLAVALLLVLAASPLTSGRLRVPAMPFLCLAAAAALGRASSVRGG